MKPLRVLLVEDSPSDVRLIREAMRETAIRVEVIVACDGVEAMDFLHKAELGLEAYPDVIILDLNLPRMNGHEVLAEVKASPGLKFIPVVIMTSSQSDDDITQAYRLNANCYLTKPSDLREYLAVVRSIEEFWFLTATLPESASRGAAQPKSPGYATGSPVFVRAASRAAS